MGRKSSASPSRKTLRGKDELLSLNELLEEKIIKIGDTIEVTLPPEYDGNDKERWKVEGEITQNGWIQYGYDKIPDITAFFIKVQQERLKHLKQSKLKLPKSPQRTATKINICELTCINNKSVSQLFKKLEKRLKEKQIKNTKQQNSPKKEQREKSPINLKKRKNPYSDENEQKSKKKKLEEKSPWDDDESDSLPSFPFSEEGDSDYKEDKTKMEADGEDECVFIDDLIKNNKNKSELSIPNYPPQEIQSFESSDDQDFDKMRDEHKNTASEPDNSIILVTSTESKSMDGDFELPQTAEMLSLYSMDDFSRLDSTEIKNQTTLKNFQNSPKKNTKNKTIQNSPASTAYLSRNKIVPTEVDDSTAWISSRKKTKPKISDMLKSKENSQKQEKNSQKKIENTKKLEEKENSQKKSEIALKKSEKDHSPLEKISQNKLEEMKIPKADSQKLEKIKSPKKEKELFLIPSPSGSPSSLMIPLDSSLSSSENSPQALPSPSPVSISPSEQPVARKLKTAIPFSPPLYIPVPPPSQSLSPPPSPSPSPPPPLLDSPEHPSHNPKSKQEKNKNSPDFNSSKDASPPRPVSILKNKTSPPPSTVTTAEEPASKPEAKVKKNHVTFQTPEKVEKKQELPEPIPPNPEIPKMEFTLPKPEVIEMKSKKGSINMKKPTTIEKSPIIKGGIGLSPVKSSKEGPAIVCSGLTQEMIAKVKLLVRKIGGELLKENNSRSTHLVIFCDSNSLPKTTIKLHQAILLGSWVVSYTCKFSILSFHDASILFTDL